MPNRANSADEFPDPDALDRIQALWDELADFEARAVDQAATHLLRRLAAMVSAQNAYWLGAVRIQNDKKDPLRGWRPKLVRYLHGTHADETFAREAIRDISHGSFDESILAVARQAGSFRVVTLRDLVAPQWFEGAFYRTRVEPRRIVDTLFVVFPVSEVAECYYGFHRLDPAKPFCACDRAVAAFAIRGLKWFHRRLLLSHGLLVVQDPLTPAEKRVLRLLLTDSSEKEIAARLGLSATTTHGYVTTILRKFGVAGRPGLVSLWLGQRQDPSET